MEKLSLEFGTLVELEIVTYKISETKLKELRATYGECLSNNQLNSVYNEDVDGMERGLIIPFEDLTEKHLQNFYGILVGENKGYGYYYMRYGKYSSFTYGEDTCIKYEDKPNIRIVECGKDFSEYIVFSKPMIKNKAKESIKKELLYDDFFNGLK